MFNLHAQSLGWQRRPKRIPDIDMRKYDRKFPLIFIHIPKAAGSSVRAILNRWYGGGLLEHYYNEYSAELPQKRDLASLHSVARPVAVYGHFNRLRKFGVEDYYPDVSQFVTILRDPFEAAISNYYYIRKNGINWKDQSRVPKADVRTYLIETPPNMLNHFPRQVTKDNYAAQIEEFFIEIGVMEHLAESVQNIAKALGMPFMGEWLHHLNAVKRDQPHPGDLRDEYIERHPLEFEVYDYVASRF